MINSHAFKEDLKKITSMIKTMRDVDIAIFDRDSRLLVATEEYFRQKGHQVHAPSIQEVLANGNVLVNRPGHMPSCTGCRFIGDCPATIEILKRLDTDDGPLGVIALTSFTREGHDIIARKTQTYVDALQLFSQWIASIVLRKKEREKADRETRKRQSPALDAIIGDTPEIIRLKQTAGRLTGSSSTILITGETGTGKGLLAQAIHNSGPRKTRPFVPVNCTSIPDTLFESELFGYEEGAFTGARKGGKPGRFELAHQGTLFLDEIGEMPLHLQAKLLNVLQDQAFQRVGGVAFIPVDVRIIAATNQDLESMVKNKKFRADLFYRLNVIPMDLPSLADRKRDIPLLCAAFIKTANARAGRSVKGISPRVLSFFDAHGWPGNVRELQNIIEYSVNMAYSDTIEPQDLPEKFLALFEKKTGQPASGNIRQQAALVQTQAILEGLDKYGRNVDGKKRTAEELGISLRTLYRKLASL